MLEDIRHVLFPVLGIEDPCCVLFNPSAPAVSKVHRGRIYSGAAEQPEQLPSLCTRSALPLSASPSTQKCHRALRRSDSTPSAREVSSRPCEEMTSDFAFSLRNEAPPELCLVNFSSQSAVVEVFFCKITKPSKMELVDKV